MPVTEKPIAVRATQCATRMRMQSTSVHFLRRTPRKLRSPKGEEHSLEGKPVLAGALEALSGQLLVVWMIDVGDLGHGACKEGLSSGSAATILHACPLRHPAEDCPAGPLAWLLRTTGDGERMSVLSRPGDALGRRTAAAVP
eukprot:scaffold7075_cov274-Pinguiococcus_pyrenoidosus.AAC.21